MTGVSLGDPQGAAGVRPGVQGPRLEVWVLPGGQEDPFQLEGATQRLQHT